MKKILKDGPFNRISRDVITNKELSLKAKGLLTLILGLPDNWVFTIVGLQEYVQEGREALLSAMRELIEKDMPFGKPGARKTAGSARMTIPSTRFPSPFHRKRETRLRKTPSRICGIRRVQKWKTRSN